MTQTVRSRGPCRRFFAPAITKSVELAARRDVIAGGGPYTAVHRGRRRPTSRTGYEDNGSGGTGAARVRRPRLAAGDGRSGRAIPDPLHIQKTLRFAPLSNGPVRPQLLNSLAGVIPAVSLRVQRQAIKHLIALPSVRNQLVAKGWKRVIHALPETAWTERAGREVKPRPRQHESSLQLALLGVAAR